MHGSIQLYRFSWILSEVLGFLAGQAGGEKDLPSIQNLQDSSVPQLVVLSRLRHGPERSAAHVEVNRLRQARATGAAIGDHDSDRVA